MAQITALITVTVTELPPDELGAQLDSILATIKANGLALLKALQANYQSDPAQPPADAPKVSVSVSLPNVIP